MGYHNTVKMNKFMSFVFVTHPKYWDMVPIKDMTCHELNHLPSWNALNPKIVLKNLYLENKTSNSLSRAAKVINNITLNINISRSSYSTS